MPPRSSGRPYAILLGLLIGAHADDFAGSRNYTELTLAEFAENRPDQALRTARMSKGMTIMGMVVALLIFILFLLDLVIGIPFGQAGGMLWDILFVIAAAGLGFLSLTTFRELE